MTIHQNAHPLAGKTVTIAGHPDDIHSGPVEYTIEDYWDRVSGISWMDANGNPACLKYAIRTGTGQTIGGANVPLLTDEVVYGKVGPFGHLLHVNELPNV